MRLAERRQIHDKRGGVLECPLLVPSFSSKGFGEIKESDSDSFLSRCSEAFEQLVGLMPQLLISAYDLHHQLFKGGLGAIPSKSTLFLDSGGYELSPWFDLAEPYVVDAKLRSFDESDYRKVLQNLPPGRTVIATSFDAGSQGATLSRQIGSAAELFEDHEQVVANFLLKPSGGNVYVDTEDVLAHLDKLSCFDVIGFTEKELGPTLLERLLSLGRIRTRMTEQGLNIPIHLYGALDPVLTPLYFAVGADVFDGLSWLRYGFMEGLSVYRHASSFLQGGLLEENSEIYGFARNLAYINELRHSMIRFVDLGENFGAFDHHGEEFERSIGIIKGRLEG